MAQSYFKSSLRSLAKVEQTTKSQVKMHRKQRSQHRTSKHTSSKLKLHNGKFLSLNEFSRNKENSYLNHKNHIFTGAEKNLRNRETYNTISIKDFLTGETLGSDHKILPDLNKKDTAKAPKFNNYRTFSVNPGFSPPPMSKKASLV